MFLECLFKGFVIHRRHAVQDIGEVKQDVVQLVRNRWPRMRHHASLPGGRDSGANPAHGEIFLSWSQFRIHPFDQAKNDVVFLFLDGPARGFGGVRGEYRLDSQRVNFSDQRFCINALLFQLTQHSFQASALSSGIGTLIGAPAPDSVDLFSEIDGPEIGRESLDNQHSLLWFQSGQCGIQSRIIVLLFALANGSFSYCFNSVQQTLAVLINQDLTHK